MAADQPPASVEIPEVVTAQAAGDPVRCVWENELGGLTFELGIGAARRFLKWSPPHPAGLAARPLDLEREVRRLRWAAAFTPVPRVLDQGGDERGSWLLTAGLPGESAVSARWTADPARAVAAVGAGLRALHDALPVEACPFTWSVEERVADARELAREGRLDPARWEPEHRALTVSEALARVAEPPPVDALVVCHGDPCAPNTLIGDDGRWSGHVDLGTLGVADRWADLAVVTWSADWNYGPGWQEPLLDAYGVAADHDRITYYRLLWELAP